MSVLDLPHIGFVIAAYASAAIVIGALIAMTVLDYRAQRSALAAYDARQAHRPGPEGEQQ